MGAIKWTTKRPTKTGWHWWRNDKITTVVHMVDGTMYPLRDVSFEEADAPNNKWSQRIPGP